MKVLIFAGTTEGRELFEFCCENGVVAYASVATEYGKTSTTTCVMPQDDRVFVGRKDAEQIRHLLHEKEMTLVIDATHPYAVEATRAIHQACEAAGVEYVRLVRADQTVTEDAHLVDSMAEAATFLNHTEGGILCTTGAKELDALCAIEGYRTRVIPRVLPLEESIVRCITLGFTNIIGMNGPFSAEMNAVTIRQYNCRFLLTKSSGAQGGFEEKLTGAKATHAQVVIVRRPERDIGISEQQVIELLRRRWQESHTA